MVVVVVVVVVHPRHWFGWSCLKVGALKGRDFESQEQSPVAPKQTPPKKKTTKKKIGKMVEDKKSRINISH